MQRKKRIWIILGGLLTAGLSLSSHILAFAQDDGIVIPLYHHHTEACLGEVTVLKEADTYSNLTTVGKDLCTQCGGEHHIYGFRATCSCGRTWNTSGHACINSPYGSNPDGGCSNYGVIDCNTLHEHTALEQICGREITDEIGRITIGISSLEPAREVELTASYEGLIDTPDMVWTEEAEDSAGDADDEDPEEKETGDPEDDGSGGKVPEEDAGREACGEEETDAEESGGNDLQDDTTKEHTESKLGSSICVVKNGRYMLTGVYEEDGTTYRITKTLEIGNIDRIPPVLSYAQEPEEWKEGNCRITFTAEDSQGGLGKAPFSFDEGKTWTENDYMEVVQSGTYPVWVRDRAGNITRKQISVTKILPAKPQEINVPAAPEVIPEEPEGEILPKQEEHPAKVSPAVLVIEPEKEAEDPGRETKRRMPIKEESPTAEPKEENHTEEKEELKGLPRLLAILPRPVVTAAVSVTAILGALLVAYGMLFLFGTARILWKDENGKERYLTRCFIKRRSTGYEIMAAKKDTYRSESSEFIAVLPRLFVSLHRYRPIRIRLGGSMVSLHVERKIPFRL